MDPTKKYKYVPNVRTEYEESALEYALFIFVQMWNTC